jgi:NRAMP (natural resistance-associated macrophage protein)-like metal ion transporter
LAATLNQSSLAPAPKDEKPESSSSQKDTRASKFVSRCKSTIGDLGPGLITGSSDDDPSGIAAFSQTGAEFGYSTLWTMFFSYPLVAAIQEISARIGRVTGAGIAANLRRHYPPWLLYLAITLVVLANVANLGADIGGMAAAAQLLFRAPMGLYVVAFGSFSLAALIFIPYTSYAKYLKWLTLSLFAYVAVAFMVRIDWLQAARSTFIPQLRWDRSYLTAVVALLGTTISPYLFFWQASQEVEEVKTTPGDKPLKHAPGQARRHLQRIRSDTYIGMAFSNIVSFFIILTSAATLHAHGQTEVNTAAQAAQALAPLAGRGAEALFACGIIGTGLLAVPVLAGSAGYAIGEARKWRASLEQPPTNALRFYGAIAVATLAGMALNFLGIDPMRALFWAAVFNGVVAAPLMALIVHLASSRKVMGKFVIPVPLRIGGWIATLVMAAACLATLDIWK